MISKEIEKQIINAYLTKFNQKECAEYFNIDRRMVGYILNKNNIYRKPKIPKEYHQIIINDYLKGDYIENLAKNYNVSFGGIRNLLIRYKIELRNKGTRYTVNENYFNCIDTEDKAYFLGLLMADGCNTKNGIQIALQE